MLETGACAVCAVMFTAPGVRRQKHHAVYEQRVRREGGSIKDRRNVVLLCAVCHADHHSRKRPIALGVLGDGVFEFAAEVLGPGPAYGYLRRRYSGEDPRLDALLEA